MTRGQPRVDPDQCGVRTSRGNLPGMTKTPDTYRYDERPAMVYWELTRACDLACIHCRADAVKQRHPLELSTAESRDVLHQIASFSDPSRGIKPPHLVFTGACGSCPAREVCGGSRARAYALSGNPFAGDPLCPFPEARMHS